MIVKKTPSRRKGKDNDFSLIHCGVRAGSCHLVGFGLDTARAIAQSTYEFSATYDTVVTIDPNFRPDIGVSRVTITGESTDAPYGLANFLACSIRLRWR